MTLLLTALKDLRRPRHWVHAGPESEIGAGPESEKVRHWPWWSRMDWKFPWIGGDEWCRWTLVLSFPIYSLVIPLWGCRDPECEACEIECTPMSAALIESLDQARRGQGHVVRPAVVVSDKDFERLQAELDEPPQVIRPIADLIRRVRRRG